MSRTSASTTTLEASGSNPEGRSSTTQSWRTCQNSKTSMTTGKGGRQLVTPCLGIPWFSLGWSTDKCVGTDHQCNSWWLDDDQRHCLSNERTNYSLTMSFRRPVKLGCRSNSLCFCTTHTSSHVSSELCTFRCLHGHVCQRSCGVVCHEVRNMVKNSQVTITHVLDCNIHTRGPCTSKSTIWYWLLSSICFPGSCP